MPNELFAGRTHTSRLLPHYCSNCALYHSSADASVYCRRLQAAHDPLEELAAWRALKAIVSQEILA